MAIFNSYVSLPEGTFQFHEMLAAKVWTSHGVLGKASNHKTLGFLDFPAAVWPFPIWNDTFSTHTARWNMIPQFGWIDQWEIYDTVFTKHVTVKDSQDYTRSFLIHLKKYIPYSSTSGKKTQSPSGVIKHGKSPSSIGESSSWFSMSAMTSRYMSLGIVSCTLWLWLTVC